jgi:hypothetical protein
MRSAFTTVLLLAAVAAVACTRRATPVAPELRAAVGRELSIDASRIDPDVSLLTVKPDIDDVETVSLVLGLSATFNVDIQDDAMAETLGLQPHAPPTRLTLNNLARLIATAPPARPKPPGRNER